MRKILFYLNKLKAAILPGTKRAHALLSRHKKFSYWSAAVLAILVAPFAVQAMVPGFAGGGSGDERHVEESTADVKSSVDEQTKSNHSSEVEVNSDSNASGSGNSDVDVTINGQNVPVPENGTIHKRMSDNGNETVVDIQIDNDSSSNNSSSSSTTIDIDSQSHSSGQDNSERGNGRHPERR